MNFQSTLKKESINHDNVYLKRPLTYKAVGYAIAGLEKVYFRGVSKYVYNLYFTPLRYKLSPEQERILDQATIKNFTFKDETYSAYSWGSGQKVLMVHGLNGRAAQFYAMIETLVKKGFQPIAFDFPGHGSNPKKMTDIPECAEFLLEASRRYGDEFFGIIAHSLGVNWSISAIVSGLSCKKIICIGPVASCANMLVKFGKMLNLSPTLISDISNKLVSNYGEHVWSKFSAYEQIGKIKKLPDCLVMHDKDDREVPVEEGKALHEVWPNSRLKITEKYGHRRILRSEMPISIICEFLK